MRRAWRFGGRAVVIALVVGAACRLLGLSFGSAGTVALAVAVLVLAVERVETAPEPALDPDTHMSRHGVRGEVAELSWAMVARDGSAGDRAVCQVRAVAARRLARHGVDLAAADASAQVAALLGADVARTLTDPPNARRSLRELATCVEALERLGSTPHARSTL